MLYLETYMRKRFVFLKIFQSGIAILSCLLAATGAQAAESKLISEISIKQTYNDNIDFSTTEEKNDLILTIAPILRWNFQTEMTGITANAKMNVVRYGKEHNLDEVKQKYSLGYDFRATELFGLNLNGSLIKDTTLDTEMEETGVVLKRTKRDFYHIKPGLSWYMGEKTRLNLTCAYTRAEYEASRYSDYDIYDGTLELVHTLSEEGATVFAQGGYTYSDYETSDVDNYRLHLGLSYPFTQKLKLTAWAGARYTKSEYEVKELERVYLGTSFYYDRLVKKTESDRNWGGLGSLSLTRAFTDGSVSVGINRDINSSGLGETIVRDRATLDIYYRFTQFITGRFNSSLSISKSESKYRDTDQELYYLRPSLSWQITERFQAELSYQYSKIEYKNINTHTDRNIIFLRFRIHWNKLI